MAENFVNNSFFDVKIIQPDWHMKLVTKRNSTKNMKTDVRFKKKPRKQELVKFTYLFVYKKVKTNFLFLFSKHGLYKFYGYKFFTDYKNPFLQNF